MDRAMRNPDPGPDVLRRGDTTYFTVAGPDGMMVSMIQSNFRGMGSGLVADGLGFMFQDRGQLLLLKFAERLAEIGVLENMPKMEGRRMLAMFAPKGKKKA